MAPMIDVIFLLLIFFLVAGKWRPEEDFLPFQLPTAQAYEASVGKPEPLMVYIEHRETGCRVRISRTAAVEMRSERIEEGLADLMKEIKVCLLAQKRVASDPVEIICDGKVKWDYVAKIYNTFYGIGLTDITFQMTE
jgi:biopolymer transport protein ExbD